MATRTIAGTARVAVTLSCALAALCAAGAVDAHAREVVEGFDDRPAATRLTDEVAGVRFLDPVEVFRPRSAPFSPANGLRRVRDCGSSGADACASGASQLRFALSEPARTVSVRVGDDEGGCFEFCTAVRMLGYDASGAIVADSILHAPRPYAADPGTFSSPLTRPVTMSATHYSIARVRLMFGSEGGVPGAVSGVPDRVQLDDLRFTVHDPDGRADPVPPPVPAAPTVEITDPADGALVPDGAFMVRGRARLEGSPTALCAAIDADPAVMPAGCGDRSSLPADGSFALPLRDVGTGEHTVTVYVRDAIGRVATASRRLSVGADVQLDLLDVNQVVQRYDRHRRLARLAPPILGVHYEHRAFEYRGVPLAAGKHTFVRLHARIRGSWTLNRTDMPSARLHAYRRTSRGGLLPLGSVLPRQRPVALGNERLAIRRANADAAYEFTLPSSWTEPGRIVLIGEVSPPGAGASLAECNACRADNAYRMELRFVPQRRVKVTTVKLLYDGVRFPARAADAFYRFGLLAPLKLDVEPFWLATDVSGIDPTRPRASRRVADRVRAIKDKYDLGGVTIGLHAGRYRGLSVSRPFAGWLDLVPEDAAHADWRRPLASVGHELMHQLGFPHAGRRCPRVRGAEKWPPDETGAVQGWAIEPHLRWDAELGRHEEFHQIVGTFEPGRFEPPAGARTQLYDLMSYCGGDSQAWISVRNWTRLLRR